METVSLIEWSLASWLAILATVIFYPLLTGRIQTRGLLSDGTVTVAPLQIQLLVSTFSGGVSYALYASRSMGADTPPPAPTELIGVTAGSQVSYLIPKILRYPRRS